MFKIVIAGASLVCVLAAGAPASAHGDHTAAVNALRERFKQADANSDDNLSRAEWDAHLKSRFAGYDKNSDGKLVTDEIDGLIAALHGAGGGGDQSAARAELLKAYDADGDRAISQAEYVGASLVRFDGWDLNKDGTVNKAEQAAELTRMAG